MCLTREAKLKCRQVKGNHKVCDTSNHLSFYSQQTMIIHRVVVEEEQPTSHARLIQRE